MFIDILIANKLLSPEKFKHLNGISLFHKYSYICLVITSNADNDQSPTSTTDIGKNVNIPNDTCKSFASYAKLYIYSWI